MTSPKILGLESAIPDPVRDLGYSGYEEARPLPLPERTGLSAEALLRPLKYQAPPVISNMLLPEDRLKGIEAALKDLGFSWSASHLETSFHVVVRFTVLTKDHTRRALLYIMDEVLKEYDREKKLQLEEVRDLFQLTYQKLYIFHDSLPAAVFRNLMEGEWRDKYGIDVAFIALSYLAELEALELNDQKTYLQRVLDLEKPPARHVTNDEKLRLQRILIDLSDFEDQRGRRVLVESAGLGEFATNFVFEGKAKIVAWDLIAGLRGHLKELLQVISNSDDLNADDKEFIGNLLMTCSFD